MNPDQVPELLKRIALADPRIVRDDRSERIAMAAMWAGILVDVPFQFALQATQQHYAASPFPIQPADICERWRKHLRDARERDTDAEPDADPDDVGAWLAALREGRQRHVAGARPRPVAALVSGVVQARHLPPEVAEILNRRRPPAQQLPCPWEPCRARPGQPCTNQRGQEREPHPSRVDAWVIKTAACPTCRAAAGDPCRVPTTGDLFPHGVHRERPAAAKETAA